MIYLDEPLPADLDVFGDMTAAMQDCRDVVLAQVQQEFSSETDPFGIPWEPWYWTSDWPVQEHKTLQHTGLLMASFVSDQSGHIEEITANEMVFGSNVEYGMKHQTGGESVLTVDLFGRHGGMLKAGSSIHLPARPIVGWPEQTIASCAERIEADILGRWYA